MCNLEVVDYKTCYQVQEDGKVHATYTFNPLSPLSKTYAKMKAEGFKQGYLYAKQEQL